VQRFSIEPSGPFNLHAARQFFGGWAAMAGEPDSVLMAFPVEGWDGSAVVVVRQSASVVEGNVYSAPELAEAAWQQALAALSLDFDGSGFLKVGERDPVIGRLQSEFEQLRPVCFYSPYEAACSFVIGHRLSMAQARTLRTRLAEAHGDAVTVGTETVHAFPRPQVLLEIDSFGQIAGEKMERVHGIAEAALAGRLDRARLRALAEDEALAELRTLRGVGEFIASGILLRGAGVADAVPSDEVTQQAVQRAYELPSLPDRAELLRIAEAWRPYRMWSCVLLHLWLRSGAAGEFRPVGGKRR
jgi:DNA-3-methyladenine glycosylase II